MTGARRFILAGERYEHLTVTVDRRPGERIRMRDEAGRFGPTIEGMG